MRATRNHHQKQSKYENSQNKAEKMKEKEKTFVIFGRNTLHEFLVNGTNG